jgi:hypothetical protein
MNGSFCHIMSRCMGEPIQFLYRTSFFSELFLSPIDEEPNDKANFHAGKGICPG